MPIGVDIGAGSIRAARVSPAGLDGPRPARPVSADLSAEEVRRRLLEVVAELAPEPADGGIGVAFPGFRDAAGRVAFAANLPGLDGSDLEADLAPVAAGLPVLPVPDVAAAAVGEARLGTGRGVDRFLCAAIGTGVNAAMTVGGRVLETAYGCLGDAGHVNVEPDGPPCPCGGAGCLEAVCSGLALARDGRPLELPSAEAVVRAAGAGDPDAGALVRRAGAALGRAIATWCVLTFPDRVAVAGGVSRAGELLLEPARAELRRVGPPYAVGAVEVVLAELGAEATLTGAGLVALEELAAQGAGR